MPEGGAQDEHGLTYLLAFDPTNPASIVSCIATARENARQIREKISSEMWLQLNKLYLDVRSTQLDDIWDAQPHEFFRAVKDGVHLFQGVTASTLSRDEGWNFIQLGRYLERATSIATLLDSHLTALPISPRQAMPMDEYFEWLGLLKCFTAFEAYCKIFRADLRSDCIVEFLLLNAEFPHAVRFCAEMMQQALQAIAESTGTSKNQRVHRLAGRLRADLSFDQLDDIQARGIHAYLDDLRGQCQQIHQSIYESYIAYPIELALS
jgi:uncharacterized alpha-E superfamily protein